MRQRLFLYLVTKFRRTLYNSRFEFRFRIANGPLKDYNWSSKTSDISYLSGAFDKELTAIIMEKASNAKVVFDIGANEGYYSLLFEKFTPAGSTIVAAEPLPANVEILKKHCEWNESNVQVIPVAVYSNHGQVVSFTNSHDRAANAIVEGDGIKEETIEVSTTTIDAMTLKFGSPQLIKIDAEGAEYEILRGAEQTLRGAKPSFVISVHERLFPGMTKQCGDLLAEFNYSFDPVVDVRREGHDEYFCAPR